ncbi:MAG: CHAP domain-containing protein [Clostridia bacterium]|nr:CHAP domain-containing protein [Clostridia bacterium]
MRKRIGALLLVGVMAFTSFGLMESANAKTITKADKFVKQAEKYLGKTYKAVWLKGKHPTCNWCNTIPQLASKNGKLGKYVWYGIGRGYAYNNKTLLENTVKKCGAEVNFIYKNKYSSWKKDVNSKRCHYDPNYDPQRGDLVFFTSSKGSKKITHVGIVTKDSNSAFKVYTIEGNMKSGSYKTKKTMKLYRESGSKHYYTSKYILCYVHPDW